MTGVAMSTVAGLMAMLGVTVSILAVVIGTVVRATRAFTKVEVASSTATASLQEYIKEDRVNAAAYQAAQALRNEQLGARLSTVELQLARIEARSADHRSA
jgi:hypothetical protein